MSEILVVGADSLIGAALYQELSNCGIDVIGTSRRPLSPHKIHLNLLDNLDHWAPPSGITSAVICAGMTNVENCEKEPDISRNINVTATKKLIDKLILAGIHVVYLSSDLVSDKSMLHKQYSIQKAEVEIYLQKYLYASCVVRMSKVIPSKFDLFVNWALDLQNNRVITPFLDKYFSPITLEFCANFLLEVVVKKKYGLYVLEGSKRINYYDAALELAKKIGANSKLIQPKYCFIDDIGSERRKINSFKSGKLILEVEPLSAEKIIIDAAG